MHNNKNNIKYLLYTF